MIDNRLKRSFDKYFDAPIEVWQSFENLCELVKFKKNEVIKPVGNVEKWGYFILTGSCGVFIWKGNNYMCLDLMCQLPPAKARRLVPEPKFGTIGRLIGDPMFEYF